MRVRVRVRVRVRARVRVRVRVRVRARLWARSLPTRPVGLERGVPCFHLPSGGHRVPWLLPPSGEHHVDGL